MKKVVIVTGANAGMGKALSLSLAKMDFHVVMACRNLIKGEEARAEVIALSNNPDVSVIPCDLASLKSIKTFVDTFVEKFDRLDVLINNAGLIVPSRQETIDGFELQFGVNHLGHFYLTLLLLELLKKTGKARIVTVSSGAHKMGRLDLDQLSMDKGYGTFKAYSRSKLANILFTKKLSNMLMGTGVTANCCHPGAVGTTMGVNRENGRGKGLLKFLGIFFLTPEEGSKTALYLATSEEVEGMSGDYYYKCKPVLSSKKSLDPQLADLLWETSLKMVGLT